MLIIPCCTSYCCYKTFFWKGYREVDWWTSKSPLWLCYAKSTPVFSTAATRCSNIHTWYRNIINCICFTGTSIVADARNCCKYIWKFEGKSYIWSTCIVSKSPLWLAPNYNPVNIIKLGYIRSIWLICTSCNSSIRCRTSRAAPFARSRCNCKEHVCKWYW